MSARCIDCKGSFNRSVAVDKLRCPNCTDAPKDAPEWKKKLTEVTKKKEKKGK